MGLISHIRSTATKKIITSHYTSYINYPDYFFWSTALAVTHRLGCLWCAGLQQGRCKAQLKHTEHTCLYFLEAKLNPPSLIYGSCVKMASSISVQLKRRMILLASHFLIRPTAILLELRHSAPSVGGLILISNRLMGVKLVLWPVLFISISQVGGSQVLFPSSSFLESQSKSGLFWQCPGRGSSHIGCSECHVLYQYFNMK
jgi:hypothetical protein